jgi:predicted RNase H-like nuclease (RuvC/YqgF family)
VGREMEVKDKQISTLQNQLDEMMDKPDDSSEEYLLKIKNLENQIKTLRKEDDDNELRDQVIALEVSPHS